jgi:hypothetical protein
LAAGAQTPKKQTPFPLVTEPNLPHARHGQHQRFSRPCSYPLVGCGGVQAGRRRPNPSGLGQVRRIGWSGACKPPKLARERVMRPKNRFRDAQVPTPGSRVLSARRVRPPPQNKANPTPLAASVAHAAYVYLLLPSISTRHLALFLFAPPDAHAYPLVFSLGRVGSFVFSPPFLAEQACVIACCSLHRRNGARIHAKVVGEPGISADLLASASNPFLVRAASCQTKTTTG